MMVFENINRGLDEYRATPGGVLVDVRERKEYDSGHIPGAVNLPLSAITTAAAVAEVLPAKDVTVFLYCLRGSRSRRAAGMLRSMGYRSVRTIGGIKRYRGPVE